MTGHFHASLRRLPEVACRVSSQSSSGILSALDVHELDLGVLCAPERLPRGLRVTHRFHDAFTLIAPSSLASSFDVLPKTGSSRLAWLKDQNWLLIDLATNTGQRLRQWMGKQRVDVEPSYNRAFETLHFYRALRTQSLSRSLKFFCDRGQQLGTMLLRVLDRKL